MKLLEPRYTDSNVRCVWEARARLGESPSWDPWSRILLWVDIGSGTLSSFDPLTGSRSTTNLQQRLCSVDMMPGNGSSRGQDGSRAALGCGDVGFGWVHITDELVSVTPVVTLEHEPVGNRFNDGKLGPDGRYWAGTMDDSEQRTSGSLYAFDRDGAWSLLDTGYRVPNGPTFSPDGSIVYHTDSALREIYAFDLRPDGSLAGKRVFAQFKEDEGVPDGMTTDRDGYLWVAMWDGARLQRLSPEGEPAGSVPIPTRRPTSCTFVDPECTEMYVTSASVGLGSEDRLAGGLFHVRLA